VQRDKRGGRRSEKGVVRREERGWREKGGGRRKREARRGEARRFEKR